MMLLSEPHSAASCHYFIEPCRRPTYEALGDINDSEKLSILEIRAKIAKIAGDDLLFCALGESILAKNPESELRFDVAYAYSKLEMNEQSVRHYEILTNKQPNETLWNNLGVAYSSLGLDGLSVEAYYKSKDCGGTLAVSNLAFKFASEGFFEEARELCRAVISDPKCDKRVATALANVEARSEDETEKREVRLRDARKNLGELILAGTEAVSPKLPDGSYKFRGDECDYEIVISGSTFLAKYMFKKPSLGSLLTALKRSGETFETEYEVTLEGKLVGRTGIYRQEIFDKSKKATALLTTDSEKSTGLIVFGQSGSVVKYISQPELKVFTHPKSPG